MTRESGILSKLFAGYDAGFYGLPDELVARRRAQERVAEALREVNGGLRAANPAAVRSRIVAAIIEGAGNGGIPSGYEREFVEEQAKLTRLSAAESILAEARTELAEQTPWLAMRLSETILADYLRPALNTVLDAVRSGADVAPSVPWGNQAALVRASDEARDYYGVVSTAAEHYRAIREAQQRVRDLAGHPSKESFHRFGALRNMHEIWPTRDSGVQTIHGRAPWPEDPLEWMVWLVTSEAEPWMPTAAECDAMNADLIARSASPGGVVAGDRR